MSYASQNPAEARWVEQLALRLQEQEHFSIWLGRWELIPGQSWQQAKAQGLDQANCCIVCIGKQTEPGWSRNETELALARQLQDPDFRYSRADAGMVRQLASTLSEAGVRVWLDQWELVPGLDWNLFLNQAMQMSRAIGICIGRHRQSDRLDMQHLLELSLAQPSALLIRILFPGSSPRSILTVLQEKTSVDFRNGLNNAQAINKLITTLLEEQKEEARASFEEALQIFTHAYGECHHLTLITRQNLSTLLLLIEGGEDHYQRAEHDLKEVLDEVQRSGLYEDLSALLANLGTVVANCGDYQRAEQYLQEGLNMAQHMGHRENICYLLTNLGALETGRENYRRAEQYLKEGLTLAREMEYRENISILFSRLGTLAMKQGNYPLAERYLCAGLKLARKMGHRERICSLLQDLGILANDQGDYQNARSYFQQSLWLAKQSGYHERGKEASRYLQMLPQF